ncbi:hypothetical protein FOZ60_005442 [Perkinsus olseni]|uniref:Uncharacterized protein n=1 Tax=Perkinsus olseni TaxID=32597 RepID=A0A7J6NR70_PEROL|nr:hypothetical protein FOZ60_005442 [Perkinsus olseni]
MLINGARIRPGFRVAPHGGLISGARYFSDKHRRIQRVRYPWKQDLLKMNWQYLHHEMMDYFKGRPTRDSTVELHAKAWPKFAQSPFLVSEGYVPGIIVKRGYDRKVIFKKSDIEAVAFDDDPQAHISHLFMGRMFRVIVEHEWIEDCVVVDYKAHPVNRQVFFVRFNRHIPGSITEIDIPVTLVGVFGSHAHLNRAQIDLAMPTIKLQCVGEKIPPPFLVDCSKLRMEEPYGAITLRDIMHLLPEDGTARFHPSYDLDETEIVHAYRPYSIPEQDIPEDYIDPNFVKQNKKRYHLTYSGYWPRHWAKCGTDCVQLPGQPAYAIMNQQQQQLYEYMRRVHAQQQQQQQSTAVPGMVAQPGPVSPAMALQLLSRQQQMYTQQAAAFMPHTMPGMMPGAARMMPYPMGAAGMPRPGMMPFGMPPFMARQGTQQPQDSTASEIEIAMAVIEIKLGTDRLTSLKILQQVAKRQVKANRGDKMITFTVGTPPTPANPQSVCGYVALCKATGRIYVCSSSKDLANKFAMNVNNLARNRLKQLPHHRAFEMSSRAQHSSYLTAAHANTSAKGIYRVVNLVAVARFPDVVDVVKLAAAKEKILEQENCVRVHFDPSEVSSGTSVAVTIVHEVPPPVPASQPEQPAAVPQSPGGGSGTPSSKRPRPEDDGLDEPELHVLMSPMNKRPRVDSSASRLSDGLGTEDRHGRQWSHDDPRFTR